MIMNFTPPRSNTAIDAFTKEETLSNTTAEQYGLSSAAVPNDVLSVLSRLSSGLGNEHLWKVTGDRYVLGFGVTEMFSYTEFSAPSNYFYSESVLIDSDGTVTMTSPKSFSYVDSAVISGLAGKYITGTELHGIIARVSSITTTSGGGGWSYTYQEVYSEIDPDSTFFINSPDENAYPPAEDDGNTYSYLGRLGDSTKIETGSYTGTGTYGYNNRITLTFSNKPILVVVYDATYGHYMLIAKKAPFSVWMADAYSSHGSTVLWSNSILSYYNTDTSTYMMNNSGIKYYYIAIVE